MGGYTNAEKGQPENALSGLLGVPVFRYLTADTAKAEDIYKLITEADEKNYPMTATTGSDANEVKLPTDRTYSILSTFKLKVKDKETSIYFMKDPSGEKNYEGTLKNLIDPSLSET